MLYTPDLCTVTLVRRLLDIPQGGTNAEHVTAASEDTLLRSAVRQASGVIAAFTNRTFVPYMATLKYARRHRLTPYLMLTEDLLAVTTLTNGDGTVISSGDYALYPNDGFSVACGIEVINTTWSFSLMSSRVQVAGVWGWHNQYARAFAASGDTLSSSITSTATSITVSDADGVNSYGETRFETGAYLRIDSEYLQVVSVDVGTNVVTVLRGVNGSTAASHNSGVSVEVFRPLPTVEMAAARIAAHIYQTRDATTNSVTFLDTNVTLADRTVGDALRMLESYRRRTIEVI